VLAIAQTHLKRMLAYSSIAQIGYIALGVGLGTPHGFVGAILHILNHACMKACLFLVSANLEARGKGVEMGALDASLRRDLPVSSGCFAVAAISMIGLPPTAGFFSKWYLLLGSYEAGYWVYVVVILLSSLLNAVYFFRILERMYLGGAEGAPLRQQGRGLWLLQAPVVVLAVSLIGLGLGNVFLVTRFIHPMLPANL
jgi:multicomponent Na+:H+ antiporter subunit D